MRLFLCEKPSQGKDIGRILGATQRGEGCLNGSGVTVTWCIGHLVEAAPPEAYDAQLKRWSIEQLPIIPERWRVEVKPRTAAQFKVVKALLAKATHLVIATDADREGELIAREIIELCGYRGPIERLWLSALNDASIRAALGKLRPSAETLPMYYSALARSRADWLAGMNLSRLFTVLGRRAGYDGVLSVGRVQTPTLKLVVDRDREIAAFVSVPYWAIDVALSTGGQAFSAQWVPPDACTDDAGRCVQQPVAQQAAQRQHPQFIAFQAEVAAEARRPDRATERVLVGIAVALLHLAQPDERGRVAQDRIDHRLDPVLEPVEVELLAVLQVAHDLGDAVLQRGMDLLRVLEFGPEFRFDRPAGLAQALELVVLDPRRRRLEREEAHVRRGAALRIDPDVAADALQLHQVLLVVEHQPFHRERRLQPGPVEPADVHAQDQALDTDPHIAGAPVHHATPVVPLPPTNPVAAWPRGILRYNVKQGTVRPESAPRGCAPDRTTGSRSGRALRGS